MIINNIQVHFIIGLLPPRPTLTAVVAIGPVPLDATEDEVVGVDVETSPVAGVADPGVDDTADVVAALAISGAIGGLVMLALVLVGGIGRGLGILVSYKGFRTPPTKVRVF